MRNIFIIVLASFLSFPAVGQEPEAEDKSLPEMAVEILVGDCEEPTASEAVEEMFLSAPEADIVDIVAAVLEICGACADVRDAVSKATELAPDREADIQATATDSLDEPDECALNTLASPLCSELTNCSSDDLASPN